MSPRLPVHALFAALLLGTLATDAAAEPERTTTPVRVAVVGQGRIRVVVADGTSRPCDASGNRVLFDGRASAGETLDLASTTGSVCVDHTYGRLRESQWAGASIWSGSSSVWSGARTLDGSVSTEAP